MSEYIGIIEYTRGKGAGLRKRLVSFECWNKRMRGARTLVSSAALDTTEPGEKVELLGISRLKDGVPVDTKLLDYKPAMAVILSRNYGKMKDTKTATKEVVVPLLQGQTQKKKGKTPVAKGVARAVGGGFKRKAKRLPQPLTTLDMDAISDYGNVYKYDNFNQRSLEDSL